MSLSNRCSWGGGTPLFSQVAEQQLRLREHRTLNDDTLLLRYEVDRAENEPASPLVARRDLRQT
ncbi:MAG: hypothetical protein ACNA8R_00825 [Nitriliruptoraceae bacterium]